METMANDFLCNSLLSVLERFDAILVSENASSSFDVQKDANSREKYTELRRLRRSLEQYAQKTGALTYVGFLGHFSAGKSSTINSFFKIAGVGVERLTGLHPTDRAVTLITHPDNSGNLVGAFKRGELEVGSSLVDSEMLRQRVLVDTPGTGDPLEVEEMVRDFLPICDRIIYFISAAIPLDQTDLPILQKIHRDLPFIPMRFVVTRADEFRRDHCSPLSPSNFDKVKADIFLAELLSRLAAVVPKFSPVPENVLLVDNLFSFNLDRLETFLFPTGQVGDENIAQLHAHKIAYYFRSSREIRDYYKEYVQRKLNALNSLLGTAKTNHEQYQQTVTMANSRLTEYWVQQRQSVESKKSIEVQLVSSILGHQGGALVLDEVDALKQVRLKLHSDVLFWAQADSATVCRSLKSKLSGMIHEHIARLQHTIEKATDPNTMALSPLVLTSRDAGDVLQYEVRFPLGVLSTLGDSQQVAVDVIRNRANALVSGSDRVADRTRERRFATAIRQELEKSCKQISEMLDGFFTSVHIYRSAIVSLNARETAERVGIVHAIDEVERAPIPEEKKTEWFEHTVGLVFPRRREAIGEAEREAADIAERLAPIHSQARQLAMVKASVDVASILQERVEGHPMQRDPELLKVVHEIVSAFNELSATAFAAISQQREQFIASERAARQQRFVALARARFRRACKYVGFGCLVGLLGFLSFYFWRRPFADNWTAAVLAGAVANCFTGVLSWLVAKMTDHTKDGMEREEKAFIGVSRDKVCDLLHGWRPVEDWAFLDAQQERIKNVLFQKWKCLGDAILADIALKPLKEVYLELTRSEAAFRDLCAAYTTSASRLSAEVVAWYNHTEHNLNVLAEVSAAIREEAILPSFRVFEARGNELRAQLASVVGLEMSP